MRLSQIVLAALTAVAICNANWGLAIIWIGLFLFTVIADHQRSRKL